MSGINNFLSEQEIKRLREEGGALLNIKESSVDMITDPLILEFISAISDQEYLDFEVLQQKEFMKFWPYIAIHRYADGDFTYIYFGSYLVDHFGFERTGVKVSEIDHPVQRNELLHILNEVLNTKKPSYAVGNLEIFKKGYKKWQQIKIPLRRNGQINEVLSFIVFS